MDSRNVGGSLYTELGACIHCQVCTSLCVSKFIDTFWKTYVSRLWRLHGCREHNLFFLRAFQLSKNIKTKTSADFSALLKNISSVAVAFFSFLHMCPASPRIWPGNLGRISLVYGLCFRPGHQMQHCHVEFQQSRIFERRWKMFIAFSCRFVGERSNRNFSLWVIGPAVKFWPFPSSA